MSNMTPERRLQKATISLMRSSLFVDWSGVLMLGKKEVRDDIPTACTDGRDESYGRAFIERLSDQELAFVVLHEAAHKMLRQLTVWTRLWKENATLANMAMDYVVNLMITDRDPSGTIIKMPTYEGKPMGLLDRRFAGMNTKQVYDILKKEAESNGGGNGNGNGNGSGSGQSLDDHDWEGAKEMTEEEQQKLARDVDQAIRQGQIAAQKMHGKDGKTGNRELMELLEPKVDWRELLREFVSTTCAARDFSSWRRPNRRFLGSDIYLPSLTGERVKCVVIGIDTSGSISDAELARNVTETAAILDSVHPEKIHVIYWDHSVAGHEEYDCAEATTFKSQTKAAGGGGTDPTVMQKYLKKKNLQPDCIIQFTDGYIGDWGNDWGAPILWCIVGGGNATSPVGKTVHIEED